MYCTISVSLMIKYILEFKREEDQRQSPPIYLINVTQIDPNMQVYQRPYWSNYLCIFYHSNSKEEHHFNIFELAVAQNPRKSTATFRTGTGMVDLTESPN